MLHLAAVSTSEQQHAFLEGRKPKNDLNESIDLKHASVASR